MNSTGDSNLENNGRRGCWVHSHRSWDLLLEEAHATHVHLTGRQQTRAGSRLSWKTAHAHAGEGTARLLATDWAVSVRKLPSLPLPAFMSVPGPPAILLDQARAALLAAMEQGRTSATPPEIGKAKTEVPGNRQSLGGNDQKASPPLSDPAEANQPRDGCYKTSSGFLATVV